MEILGKIVAELIEHGTAGLAAAFALLFYGLLKHEQDREQPRPGMMTLISLFIGACILFALAEFGRSFLAAGSFISLLALLAAVVGGVMILLGFVIFFHEQRRQDGARPEVLSSAKQQGLLGIVVLGLGLAVAVWTGDSGPRVLRGVTTGLHVSDTSPTGPGDPPQVVQEASFDPAAGVDVYVERIPGSRGHDLRWAIVYHEPQVLYLTLQQTVRTWAREDPLDASTAERQSPRVSVVDGTAALDLGRLEDLAQRDVTLVYEPHPRDRERLGQFSFRDAEGQRHLLAWLVASPPPAPAVANQPIDPSALAEDPAAQRLARQVLAEDPDQAWSVMRSGLEQVAWGDRESVLFLHNADWILQSVKQQHGVEPAMDLRTALADRSFDRGLYGLAVANYQTVPVHDPERLRRFGLASLATGRFDLASQSFSELESVTTADSERSGAANLVGVAQFRAGDYPEALGHFQEALRIWPENGEAAANLGRTLLYSGESEAAVEALQHALSLGFTTTDAKLSLSVALISSGAEGEAERLIQSVLEEDPRNARALNNLAWILAQRGDFEAALPYVEVALRRNPDQAAFNHTKGYILERLDDLEGARRYYERAVNLDPAKELFQADFERLAPGSIDG